MRRDPRLDAFRGLLMVVMTADHLYGVIQPVTFEAFGLFSAAEGFFFLSGYVAGLVFERMREREGEAATWRRALRRAGRIYALHLLTFAALFAAAAFGGALSDLVAGRMTLARAAPWEALAQAALLRYQPPYFTILPVYILLILLTPLAVIVGARRGMLVWLAGSFVAWLLAQGPLSAEAIEASGVLLPETDVHFNPFAWQFIFYIGLAFAAWRRRGQGLTLDGRDAAACAAVCLVFLAVRYGVPDIRPWFALEGDELRNFTGLPEDLNVFRVVNFLAFAGLMAWLAQRYPRAVTAPPLAVIGRHSLEVFCLHILLVYSVGTSLWKLRTLGPLPEGLTSFLFELAAVAALYPAALVIDALKRRRKAKLAPADAARG